jgi:hypothetical protein
MTAATTAATSAATKPRTPLTVQDRQLTAGDQRHKLARRASDADLLEAYLEFVRSLRNLRTLPGDVSLRDDDLSVLAQVLGWEIPQVRADLERRMASAQAASRQRNKRRAVFAAFGVGIVGSALVVVGPRDSSFASGPSVQIGSAVTIERTTEGHVVEVTSMRTQVGAVTLGDAQIITHA